MKNLPRLFLTTFILLSLSQTVQGQDTQSVTLITNANVFDGVDEDLMENADILIEGNLIKQIAIDIQPPAGAEIIDAGGRTVMPGLIDMHWHSAFNSMSIAEGFNTDLAFHLLIVSGR